jgi:MFS transporter, FHS family, glucose/mannose:H+ symporter
MPASSLPEPEPLVSGARRRPLLLVGLGAFLLIGAQQALYGPAFASFQLRFDVGVGAVGAIVSAHFLGGLFGVLAAAPLLPRVGYRRLVAGAAALVAVSAAGVASAPAWWVALTAATLGGMGYGLFVVLLNLAFARVYGRAATSALNVLNGTFGVGAVAGPALFALALGRWPGAAAVAPTFTVVAGAAAVVAVGAYASRTWPAVVSDAVTGDRVAWRLVAAFALLLATYVAVESNTPAWAPTHLAEPLGLANAALVASAFWAALTVARFLVAAVAGRVAPAALVLVGTCLGGLGLVVAHVPGWGPLGYALAGFGFGPVFPTTIAWLVQAFPAASERVTPYVLALANLGPVLGAPIVGAAVAVAGPAAVPSVLLALTVVVVGLVVGVGRASRT